MSNGVNKKILFAVVIGIIAVGVFSVVHKREKETIKIGAILSLSGPGGAQEVAIDARDGMFLAIEEVNAYGGVNGRKIELIVEDAKLDPNVGKSIFQKLEAEHRPLLYVSTHSSMATALAPQVEEHKVVLMTMITLDTQVTKNKEWVFRYWPTVEQEVPISIALLKELRVNHIGILYVNDEYGRSVFELLKEGFEKIGGQVQAESFKVQDHDFKNEISKLKDAEVIFPIGFPNHLAIIFKQLQEENFRGLVVTNNGAAGFSIRGLPEADGVYLTAPSIYNPNFLPAKGVGVKYETRFAKQFSHYAANGYEVVKLLAHLLEDQEVSRANVRKRLEFGFVHSGVFGTASVRKGEHDIPFPLYPAQILNGTLQYR